MVFTITATITASGYENHRMGREILPEIGDEFHNLVDVMDFQALDGDQGALETGFLKPMPLHDISQELSVPGLASTLNLAPVIFCAMWIAVSV